MVCKLLVIFFIAVAAYAASGFLYAQEAPLVVGIARTYAVSGDTLESGDIIAYENSSDVYRLARSGDENIIGIIVENPLLLLYVEGDGVPVAGSGEIAVNVTTLNGSIEPGDFIGVSAIPGKGMRARTGDVVVGIAKGAFSFKDAVLTIAYNGKEIGVGTISVQLNIGFGSLLPAATRSNPIDFGSANLRAPGGSVLDILKYATALLVAVGSLYVSFRSFGTNIKNSIISIGRNPLASTSIRSIVILNVILILLVGGGGLFLSLVILLLPV